MNSLRDVSASMWVILVATIAGFVVFVGGAQTVTINGVTTCSGFDLAAWVAAAIGLGGGLSRVRQPRGTTVVRPTAERVLGATAAVLGLIHLLRAVQVVSLGTSPC